MTFKMLSAKPTTMQCVFVRCHVVVSSYTELVHLQYSSIYVYVYHTEFTFLLALSWPNAQKKNRRRSKCLKCKLALILFDYGVIISVIIFSFGKRKLKQIIARNRAKSLNQSFIWYRYMSIDDNDITWINRCYSRTTTTTTIYFK